jgi:arginyl-tRNA synthetase
MRQIAEWVGVGAIRYNVIRVQPEKQMVFKWEEALNFEGNSAPFIQYSHARCCSILARAEGPVTLAPDTLTAPEEWALLRILGRYPETVLETARQRRSNILAAYAHECAATLNQFYKSCPVLKAETPRLRGSRLALVEASRWVLANVLTILGIAAPEEM